MRQKCYQCFRPKSSCICDVATKIKTNSQFIILMHPMERQKVKNNTGFITHYSLSNSILIEGIDFSSNKIINSLLNDPQSNVFILYPSSEALPTESHKEVMDNKKNHFIIVDATWPCAKKILRLSKNLSKCIPITFDKKYISNYKIKKQPKDGYISTIEATQILLKDLSKAKIEKIAPKDLNNFVKPFIKINDYQLKCINDPDKPTYSSRVKEK